MNERLRAAAGQIVEFVARTERRRLLVVLSIPILFVILLDVVANYGLLPILLAVGLAAVLYTRPTAQKTIAASIYGVGVLMIGLFVLELYWNGAWGSTEPLMDTATWALWRAVMGSALVGVGLWLRHISV